MTQEYIEIKGARENNLKNVSLRIPKRKITVFPGVSGSGKSSLVFDTIAMEAQRLLAENFSTFLRGFMPRYPQPAADSLANLNMAVVIDQNAWAAVPIPLSGRSPTSIPSCASCFPFGKPSIGGTNLFSFNDPKGMCPECNGRDARRAPTWTCFWTTPNRSMKGLSCSRNTHPETWGWTS